jgi:carbamoyltransferase
MKARRNARAAAAIGNLSRIFDNLPKFNHNRSTVRRSLPRERQPRGGDRRASGGKRRMKVLGLSFDYHDAAAALVIDGAIVAAAEEERFSRKKHDSRFPERAIRFCLEQAGIGAADLDKVVHYENPFLKFDRIVKSAVDDYPKSADYLKSTVHAWLGLGKLDVRQRIVDHLKVPEERVTLLDHHASHAGAAYFASGFPAATVVTLDGVGEYETCTVSAARGNRIEKLYSCELPDSLGLFYSAFTAFLGFEVNEGEYKVMGMAGFGEPTAYDTIRKLVELLPDGLIRMDQSYFSFTCPGAYPFTDKLIALLGKPREPESAFDIGTKGAPPANEIQKISRHYADIAASVQRVAEDMIFHIVLKAVERTDIPDVCMAGGVALNSLANGKLQKMMKGRLYVQPAAGDAGSALGAALSWYHGHSGAAPRGLVNPYIGKRFTDDEFVAALEGARLTTWKRFDDEKALIEDVADKLATGAVIGWHQGALEWGPRALGARSILANPTSPDTQRIVNEKIKFREPFRPFAPAVLAERAREFFDMPEPYGPNCPEHFMLAVATVLPDKRKAIPAVTHVDGTARVQLVRRDINPRFYALIEAFARRTGVPVLLNTSFNLRGEPIVCSPWDAMKTFSWSDMDYLLAGNVLVWKEPFRCA